MKIFIYFLLKLCTLIATQAPIVNADTISIPTSCAKGELREYTIQIAEDHARHLANLWNTKYGASEGEIIRFETTETNALMDLPFIGGDLSDKELCEFSAKMTAVKKTTAVIRKSN